LQIYLFGVETDPLLSYFVTIQAVLSIFISNFACQVLKFGVSFRKSDFFENKIPNHLENLDQI